MSAEVESEAAAENQADTPGENTTTTTTPEVDVREEVSIEGHLCYCQILLVQSITKTSSVVVYVCIHSQSTHICILFSWL